MIAESTKRLGLRSPGVGLLQIPVITTRISHGSTYLLTETSKNESTSLPSYNLLTSTLLGRVMSSVRYFASHQSFVGKTELEVVQLKKQAKKIPFVVGNTLSSVKKQKKDRSPPF